MCFLIFCKKKGSKFCIFCSDFCPFFALKPLYVVVKFYFSPSISQFCIRITLSTCLESTKIMLSEADSPLETDIFTYITHLPYHQRIIFFFHFTTNTPIAINNIIVVTSPPSGPKSPPVSKADPICCV